MTIYKSSWETVEAVKWTGDNIVEMLKFAGGKVRQDDATHGLRLLTGKKDYQEWITVSIGHWIAHLPNNRTDIWSVDPIYFQQNYREVES